MAAPSAAVTHTPYRVLTSTCRATKAHRNGLYGGSQLAVSESLLAALAWAETASRFRGSLAKRSRRSGVHDRAPFCHASDSETTWSICTSSARALSNTSVRRV